MTATPLAIQSFYIQSKNVTPTQTGTSYTKMSNAHIPYLSGGSTKASSTSSPYLPSYLLGNVNSPQPGYGRSLSSSNCNSQSKLNSRSPPNIRNASLPYGTPAERRQHRTSPQSNQHLVNKEKLGAPPTESLYSTPDIGDDLMETEATSRRMQMFASHTLGESFLTPNRSPQNVMNTSSVFSLRHDTVPQSPAQMDPFYSQGDALSSNDILDDTAVTVFGFPPAASSYILQQFSQYGTVEKHEIHNTGNWLHLKYQTRIQAKKALSKNGKIFSRTIMVGVSPCLKKEIASMETNLDSTSFGNLDTPLIMNIKPSTMRSLSTTTLRSSSAGTDIFNDKNTPQKKDSAMSKALDYVFGW